MAPPRVPSPSDVSPCHCYWPEWAWPGYPLGQMGTISRARPEGRKYCHGVHQPWLHPGGDFRTLRRCLSTAEAAWGSAAKRGQRSAFARKAWTPSKNTSGVSGHPHCWRLSRNGRLADAHRHNPQAEFAAAHCAILWVVCCHAMGSVWRSFGHWKTCTPACPGGCSVTAEEDRTYEPFPQPLALQQLPVFWRLPALRKLPTPRDPNPQGGGGIPRWHHATGIPIPLTNRRGAWPLLRGGPPFSSDNSLDRDAGVDMDYQMPPANLGDWGCDEGWLQLVESRGRGGRR